MTKALILVSIIGLASACGSDVREGGVGPDAGACTPTGPTEGFCDNGVDEDCDGLTDCLDSDCSGVGSCPVLNGDGGCEVSTPSASLELPDGDCTEYDDDYEPIVSSCSSYEADFPLTGFPNALTVGSADDLISVCVNMEHSWIRDLQIEAECPSGQVVALSRFLGRNGGPVFLGVPNDYDYDVPEPGQGWDYCWTMDAANAPMLEYANANNPSILPAGDYRPSDPFSMFIGCPLNGTWKIRVIDAWGADNGFIFESSFTFDSSLSADCEIIE